MTVRQHVCHSQKVKEDFPSAEHLPINTASAGFLRRLACAAELVKMCDEALAMRTDELTLKCPAEDAQDINLLAEPNFIMRDRR